jgi:hypothetical protein
MIISGLELKEFSKTGWPVDENNWYWDHDLFEDPLDDEKYDTDDIGAILWQGSETDPTGGEGIDLEKAIKKWRKTRVKDMFTFWIPKDKAEEFLNYVKSIGGTK